MNKRSTLPTRRTSIRQGEIGVPISKVTRPLPNGQAVISLSLDIANIPVPEKRYTADVCALELDQDAAGVRWYFGQRKVVGDDLRSLIVVHIVPEQLRNLVEMLKPFTEENREFMERNGLKRRSLTLITAEPAQTVAMSANIISVARAGREASVDFYSASPHALHSIQQTASDELAIDPIIRIDLSIGLLTSAIDWIVEHIDAFPAEAL